MTELFVNWQKNYTSSTWYKLLEITTSDIVGDGVYLIWFGGITTRVIYVGQGVISHRLTEHLQDTKILRHKSKGTLYTTWGIVAKQYRDGVERFLIDTYQPLENKRMPSSPPKSVNLLVS